MRGRVRAHDPFELIRWLALSQPDPRKALAELVQNSLDAGARKVIVTRARERGQLTLRILDDGDGVIPELDRQEALRFIATHIGHSRKRSLSPQERFTLMTQGQYGIGLLGFWSLGQRLEIRSFVPGQKPYHLILHRDDPDFLIEPLRGRLALDERRTEVLVLGLHREAMSALVGRRAADFLAAELRGQLLSREVELCVEDKISRGRAPKQIPVRPQRFLGERISGLESIDVPGHAPVRLEIYFAGEESETRGISVYGAGTLVAEGFHDLAHLGLDRAPWNDQRLSGLVDFPGFRVSPGSRRGVIADEAASAFVVALARVEPLLLGVLESIERRRIEELDKNIIRDLQRAFRDFYRQRPRFEMLPVGGEEDRAVAPGGLESNSSGDGGADGVDEPPTAEDATETRDDSNPETLSADPSPELSPGSSQEVEESTPTYLFPPGPLESVRLTPSSVKLSCQEERAIHADALDASGRRIETPASFEWRLEDDLRGTLDLRLVAQGELVREPLLDASRTGRSTVTVAAGTLEGSGEVRVLVQAEGRERSVTARIEVREGRAEFQGRQGIPEPSLVDEPGGAWRSRMQEGRWEINAGHREFRSIAEQPTLKLRYLAMLFAKEVVLRSHQDPRFEAPLEQLVEIAAFADRNLSKKRSPRSSKTASD